MLLFGKSARSHRNSFDSQKIDLDAFPRGCYAYHRLDGGSVSRAISLPWCVRARRSRHELGKPNHASG
jgi:hypothetical protein